MGSLKEFPVQMEHFSKLRTMQPQVVHLPSPYFSAMITALISITGVLQNNVCGIAYSEVSDNHVSIFFHSHSWIKHKNYVIIKKSILRNFNKSCYFM